MFALAVADLVVCIYGIILATVDIKNTLYKVATYFAFAAAIYSIILLVFVSIERLLAVPFPHRFSLSVLRTKRTLVMTTVATGVCTTILCVARFLRSIRFVLVFYVTIVASSVVVMFVCYTLMGITVTMQERATRTSIGVANSTPGPSTVSGGINEVSEVDETGVKTSRTLVTRISNATSIRAKTVKNVSLLFVITVVYLLCGMPFWLTTVCQVSRCMYSTRSILIMWSIRSFTAS